MTSSFNARKKQRAVIEFLALEGESPINISQRSEKVYGDATIGYSAVNKWVSRIIAEEEDLCLSDLRHKQRSERPSSAVDPGSSARAEELIRDDCRVTIDDIAERLGISHRSAAKIVVEIGFVKVCAKWVPRQLTDAHKQARLEACLELLVCHAGDGTCLKRVVTGDETWVHHYETESKRASMEWRHPSSSRAK